MTATHLRTMIIDDEAAARRRIRDLLRVDPEVQVVGESASGDEAIAAVERERPDLVFLDIRLPDMDGFELLSHLPPDVKPMIVFVTAFDEHAVRAFGVPAVDYLVKPFERERLYQAVARAKEQWRVHHLDVGSSAATTQAPRRPLRAPGGRIAVRVDGRVTRVRLDEIEWVEADRDSSKFHLRGGTTITTRESLTSVEQRLPESIFMRVHRSHIVNVARVREVQPWFQGDSMLILDDGTQVVTGRTYRQKIRILTQ